MVWQKRYGGTFEDKLWSADQTSDGGYIFGGHIGSDSGFDVSQRTKGSLDFWIVRTDASGNKLWDKRFGGSSYENLYHVQETNDKGFILGGFTYSDSTGDVSQRTKGGEDIWIVKTDSMGNKLWDKRYGGNQSEELFTMMQTTDGGYIMGGRVASDSSGDVSQPTRGSTDYWIVKIDSLGTKLWDRRFGGDERDYMLSMIQTNDGGYIAGGYTFSDNNGDVTEPTRDTSFTAIRRGDFWIVRIDGSGNKIWDKRYGGHWIEDSYSYIRQTNDGNFLIGGSSYSNISGEKTENNFGYEQTWLLKIDTNGTVIWDKTIFTNGEDEYGYAIPVSDSCYVVSNFSKADISGHKTQGSYGDYDFWIVKFCETTQPLPPSASFIVNYTEICSGGCVDFDNTSVDANSYQWYFPGGNPSSSTATFPQGICYADSGSYDVTLIAINNAGADTLTMPGFITVFPKPALTITQTPDTLFATPGHDTYQWFLNGSPIVTDTVNYLVYTLDGIYVVQAIDTNYCSNRDTLLINVGLHDYSIVANKINVYPNPVRDVLTVNGLDISNDGQIRLHDLLGRNVLTTQILSEKMNISTSAFKPGIYILEVINNEQKVFIRFVKE
jgi:PKD repeat protein